MSVPSILEKIWSFLGSTYTLSPLYAPILFALGGFFIENPQIIYFIPSILALAFAHLLIRSKEVELVKKDTELTELKDVKSELDNKNKELNGASSELTKKDEQLNDAKSKLAEKDKQLGIALLEIGQLKDARYTECKFSKRESAISTNCQRKDSEQFISFEDLKELKPRLAQCLIGAKAKLDGLKEKENSLVNCLNRLEDKGRLVYLNYTDKNEPIVEEVKKLLEANKYLIINNLLVDLIDDHYHEIIIENCQFIVIIGNEDMGSVSARSNKYERDQLNRERFPYLLLYSQKDLNISTKIEIVNSDTLIRKLRDNLILNS
jgi:hypothetical protein